MTIKLRELLVPEEQFSTHQVLIPCLMWVVVGITPGTFMQSILCSMFVGRVGCPGQLLDVKVKYVQMTMFSLGGAVPLLLDTQVSSKWMYRCSLPGGPDPLCSKAKCPLLLKAKFVCSFMCMSKSSGAK